MFFGCKGLLIGSRTALMDKEHCWILIFTSTSVELRHLPFVLDELQFMTVFFWILIL